MNTQHIPIEKGVNEKIEQQILELQSSILPIDYGINWNKEARKIIGARNSAINTPSKYKKRRYIKSKKLSGTGLKRHKKKGKRH